MPHIQAPEHLQRYIEELLPRLKLDATWFVVRRANRLAKQSAFVEVQIAKIIALAEGQYKLDELEREHVARRELTAKSLEASVTAAQLIIDTQVQAQRCVRMAAELGVDQNTYLAYRQSLLLSEVKIDEARRMVGIEVDKYRQLKDVDYKHEERLSQHQLKMALAFQQVGIHKAKDLLQELLDLKHALYYLYFSGKPIQLIESQANNYKRVIEGLEAKLEKLISGDDWQELGGRDPNSEYRGLPEPDMGTS